METYPTKENIQSAHERIKNFIHKTPLLTSTQLNEITNSQLFFKCENLQKVGAFKMRGASNAILSLTDNDLVNGVATHSSGNHAAALAKAAKMKNVPAYIVMPENAPEIKKNAVKSYGGEIIFCKPTLEAREQTLNEVVKKTHAVFIHPYNNDKIIEGQATCAKEIFEEESDFDFIIAPVGGGGLLSGTSLATYYFSNNTKVIGAEPAGADDAFRSIRDKKIYPSVNPQTIADGLRTSLTKKTFGIISKFADEIITVREDSILKAMKLIWERMKIIVEPSGAVPFAVILENKEKFKNKKIALILSGGNCDLNNLPWNSNKQ
ncbi:MAG: serine dehydratase [Ignavibacteriales bacterium CG_4_9_14_3_um_filter_34_10]|nr:MAG: serine dehydratase [Ignavibacteriales bacterium CG_4_9_14_3_um_filter_34_10]